MAEESGEPSDGMTQPSREKPQWVRLLPGFLLLLVGLLPWLSTVLPQWGEKLSQKRKAAGRWCKEWMGRFPLFAAIAIWAVLGIIAFLLAMWWLGRVPFWQLKLDPRKQAENIVKIALTLVGGVGAVAYLVIKYQERQQAGRAEKREKDRIVDTKVQDAINQLGSDKASTRIAGIYALTDIADRYKGGYRQRVVDILCGYLRSDRSSYAPDGSGQPVWDASGHLVESVASDEAVESTILSVMRDRLRKERKDDKTGETIVRQTVDDDQLWCDCEFDLHEATFHEDVDLTYSTFEGVPYFRGTKFERDAYFGWAAFAGGAYFDGATFTGIAYFHEAHFAGGAYFRGATFAGGADFNGATFTGGADFMGGAYFDGATFAGGAYFSKATFERVAYFGGATFAGGAYFSVATFKCVADFRGATFAGGVDFIGCAYFRGATFTGDAYFSKATFKRVADFRGAHFTGDAYADFFGAEFRASAAFSGIQDPPSFGFEECKFNERFRGAYEWGPIPIPEDNDGLPAGAVWKDFLEEDLKDKVFLELWRNLNKRKDFQEEDDKDGGTTNR